MAKLGFWGRFLIGLKGMVTSIITYLILALFVLGARWLMQNNQMVFGVVIIIAILFFRIWLWGFFANKFWTWK